MTAANAIYLSTPTRKINERSSMVVTARFRDRATNADVTPTNVYYRLDSGECGEITGWTSLTTGTTATVTLTPTQNQIRNGTRALEAKYISFAADYGLATEYRETFRYTVTNQAYVS
jgi:urease alpha subunit